MKLKKNLCVVRYLSQKKNFLFTIKIPPTPSLPLCILVSVVYLYVMCHSCALLPVVTRVIVQQKVAFIMWFTELKYVTGIWHYFFSVLKFLEHPRICTYALNMVGACLIQVHSQSKQSVAFILVYNS